jgi:hypothetical protein
VTSGWEIADLTGVCLTPIPVAAVAQRVLFHAWEAAMKLVVSQDGPSERTDSRVVLRLIQGGAVAPPQRRLIAPPPSAPVTRRTESRAAADAVADAEDIPLYLRPIPSRLPRLW